MDPAGLVLGAVPLIVGAVKAYGTTYQFIKTLRHWPREQSRFKNECSLLLTAALRDQQQANDLLEEKSEDSLLIDAERQFQECLGDSYDACVIIVQEIKERLEVFQDDLEGVSLSSVLDDNCEHAKRSPLNMRSALKTAVKKGQFSRNLQELEKWNENLGALRSEITDMQAVKDQSVSTRHKVSIDTISSFRAIQEASTALHTAFSEVFDQSCREAAHLQHQTILCLDAKVDQYVRLDIAVSSNSDDPRRSNKPATREPPIWLYVRSTTVNNTGSTILGKRRLESPCLAQALLSALSERDNASSSHQPQRFPLPPVATHDQKLYGRKKQKLPAVENSRMEQAAVPIVTSDQDGVEPQSMPDTARNLFKVANICQHFKQGAYDPSSGGICFGYLQANQGPKHFVYPATTHARISAGRSQCTPTSLAQLVQSTSHDVMTVSDQLKIAHKLAVAVLQYHSTPWMSSQWDLGDVGLFCSAATLDDITLQTLHLRAQFPKDCQTPHISASGSYQDVASKSANGVHGSIIPSCSCTKPDKCHCIADSIDHQTLLYGVNNMTLCSLGIALLQIGYCKPLQCLSENRKDPNNLYTARRLAAHGTIPLGPDFQRIVRKCLRCDFSSGTDLRSVKLQSAVFSDVVCELKQMMDGLEI
ncbi:MAG: hypothetical protein M1821_009373 [Bathelium mastoideum]|nr:MAG: hypothetical protein M1821_009373 [Bathelium mastoideum]